jgi:type II secretory pathway pseudopilin PulG
VEILVVITIMAVLISLSGGTYVLVMKTQRTKNTEALIRKLAKALQSQQSVFADQMKKKIHGDPSYLGWLNAAGGDHTLAFDLWMYTQIPQEFPTNFATASSISKYNAMLVAAGYPPKTLTPAFSQRSACLLMALTVNRGGQVFNPDTALEAGSVVSKDNPSINEIRDAWGNPLNFQWQVSRAAISNGGSGYKVNDVLIVQGGTFSTEAQLRVTSVGTNGVITGVEVVQPPSGAYSVLPGLPVNVAGVTGVTGTGATFWLYSVTPLISSDAGKGTGNAIISSTILQLQ